jgi:hypothetical protein
MQSVLADAGDIDVDPLGEGRVMLDARAMFLDADVGLVGDEEHQMRVAHPKRHRMIERPPAERELRGIHRIVEWDFIPVKERRG